MSSEQLEAERKAFEDATFRLYGVRIYRIGDGITKPEYDSRLDVHGWAIWQAARSHPAAPRAVGDEILERISAVLKGYRLHYTRDEDGDPMPLVDVLSRNYPTIHEGNEECDDIADEIAIVLDGLSPQPAQPSMPVKELRSLVNDWHPIEAGARWMRLQLKKLIAAHDGKGNG